MTEGDWIYTAERMPEDGTKCLVYLYFKELDQLIAAALSIYRGGRWTIGSDLIAKVGNIGIYDSMSDDEAKKHPAIPDKYVIAWMPLPPAPPLRREEKGDDADG